MRSREEGLAVAVEAHMALCMDMALISLEMVVGDPPYTEHTATLRDLLEKVEISAAALSVESGQSWTAMAASYGVKRQTLHRRLSRESAKWLLSMRQARDADISGRSRVWRDRVRDLRADVEQLLEPSRAEARDRLKRQHLEAMISRPAD